MRIRAAFWAATLAFGVSASSVWAQSSGGVGGTYSVFGTNRNGSHYTGTAVIRPEGDVLAFSWLISSGDTFKGTGTRDGDRIVVEWGQDSPVIYDIGEGGVLYGKWDHGLATETLSPLAR